MQSREGRALIRSLVTKIKNARHGENIAIT